MKAKAQARRLELMPLAAITGADKNPKQHAHEDIGKSIGRFGYVEPVVLDERTNRLVAGHGRVQALRAAKIKGDTPPQGVEVNDKGEWLVPVLRGWESRSDAEASAYLVASNNLTTKGGWENSGLTELLRDLETQSALEGTGFDVADVDAFISKTAQAQSATDAMAEWQGMPEFDQQDKTSFKSLIVHFKTQEDVDAFAKLVEQKLTPKTRSIWFPQAEIETCMDKAYVDDDEQA